MGNPKISVPPGISFVNTLVGMNTTIDFDISNVGEADLTVNNILGPPAMSPFMITNGPVPPFTLQPGQGASIEVTYSPLMTGMSVSSIGIKSNDPDSPLVRVELFGRGIQPELGGNILKAKEEQKEDKFTIDTKVIVRNSGDADSGPFSVGFFLSEDKFLDEGDILLKELPAASLPPNTSSVKEEQLEHNEPTRGKFLLIHIDNLDQVTEKNETNNMRFGRIR